MRALSHCVDLPNQQRVRFMDNAELNMVDPLNSQKPHWCLVCLCLFHESCVDSSGNLKGNPTCVEHTRRFNQLMAERAKVKRRLPASSDLRHPIIPKLQAVWGEGDKGECWPRGSECALLNHGAKHASRDLGLHKKALSSTLHPPQSNYSPHSPTPTSTLHSLPSCDLPLSAITMNYSKEDIASVTWPDPLWATGDYPYSSLSVPQGTYPDHGSASGYTFTAGSIRGLIATDDAAYFLAPPQEIGVFPNLSTQADVTNQVSSQCVGTSSWTYPAVPQNILDPWSMPGPSMFIPSICHYPSYLPDANPKRSSRRIPRLPHCRRLTTLIGRGSLPWLPTRRPRHQT